MRRRCGSAHPSAAFWGTVGFPVRVITSLPGMRRRLWERPGNLREGVCGAASHTSACPGMSPKVHHLAMYILPPQACLIAACIGGVCPTQHGRSEVSMAWGAGMLTAAVPGKPGAESSPSGYKGTFSCVPDIREPEISAAACPLTALESRNPAMSPSRNMERKIPVFRLSMIVPFLCFIRFLLYFQIFIPTGSDSACY